ncbi:MAG TPA: EamA family transporter [Candidatus Angelobacter sp.]|jgi:drug/metabolite transporter (DMT)-like permease|nr:EamA family transporter [Candidatus Angelobacter sp.]
MDQTIHSLSRLQWFAYVLLCLIWGSTWLAIRFVVGDVPPFLGASIRFFLAAGVLLIPAFFRRDRWPKHDYQWNALLVLGFTMIAIPYGLIFWAEQYIKSSLTAVLFSANPLIVALLTPIMMQRKVPRQAVFAMVVAFGGIIALLCTDLAISGKTLLGGVAVLGATLISAWSVVFAKKRLHDLDTVFATGMQMLIGAVGLLWATWALESHKSVTWTGKAIAALVFLAVVGSAIAFAVYYWLLKSVQPYQLSTISLLVPAIALLEGNLLNNEGVTITMLVASMVVLGSVGVALRADSDGGNIALPLREGDA